MKKTFLCNFEDKFNKLGAQSHTRTTSLFSNFLFVSNIFSKGCIGYRESRTLPAAVAAISLQYSVVVE